MICLFVLEKSSAVEKILISEKIVKVLSIGYVSSFKLIFYMQNINLSFIYSFIYIGLNSWTKQTLLLHYY